MICQSILLFLLLLPLLCVPCIFVYLLRSGYLLSPPPGQAREAQGLTKAAFDSLPIIEFDPGLFDDDTRPKEVSMDSTFWPRLASLHR